MKRMKPEIIAIIPARGGSKGIPKKNIKQLAGKPLIAYSIEAALKSKYIDRVIVSTEDEEIAEISKKYGAEVVDRPKELAKDETPTIDVIFHFLEILKMKNYNPDIVVLLQPTSPLRSAEDIDNAIKLFLDSDCESIVSVCEVEHPPYWSFKIEGGYLKSLFGDEYLRRRRQDLEKVYMPNGAIYISTPENLRIYKSFYCPRTIPYIMPVERSVDIDNEIDFMIAELVMKKYELE
jgi:CMP-N-acetylneuraminic acid synthetase